MVLTVGSKCLLTGNVTTLIWIGARTPQELELHIGYGGGRLANGYRVALLKDNLLPQDFEFEGTTLRSGGRLGLPASSVPADQLRKRVHDQMISEYGAEGYRNMQMRAISSVRTVGNERIAKVVPVTSHDPLLAPDVQYPMGGGGLQWTILPPGKNFLIAMHVNANGLATTPMFTADLKPNAPYENRHKVMHYLASA